MAQAQNPPCKFCEKKGLPILPIRYGVAPTKSFGFNKFHGTPPDPTRLLGEPDVALGAPETIYTGRRLRAGFLYVYYETHRLWDAFSVDAEACLSAVPLTDDAPPGGDRFHASCARNATKVANASLLTLSDPDSAGTIWVGFSDAWWTKSIRDGIAGDGGRDKYMRKVDVAAWYNGGQPGGTTPSHAFQHYQVDMTVAEYAMDAPNGAIAFMSSPFGFHPQSANTLKQECDALVEAKGLVLWLQDPVGIAQELSSYMDWRWKSFAEPYSRPVAVDADLSQLEQAVRRQAQDDLVDKFNFNQNAAQSLGDWALESAVTGTRHLFGHEDPVVPTKLTTGTIKHYTDAAWKPYAEAINHTKRSQFKNEFKQKSQTYNDRTMVPLAQAHAAWMKDPGTKAMFDHHYDPSDINTGVGFTTVFTACVVGTGGYGACMKLYHDWLEEGLQASVPGMNVVWRALIYNNPELAASLLTVRTGLASAGAKSGSGRPGAASHAWQAVFAAYQAVAGKLRFAGENASRDLRLQGGSVRALTAELGATLVDTIQKRGAAGDNLLATLGMHAGSPARVVTTYGTRSQLYRSIFDMLDELQPASDSSMATARTFSVYHRMRIVDAELEAAGFNPRSEQLRTWSVLLDTSQTDPATLEGPPSSTVQSEKW